MISFVATGEYFPFQFASDISAYPLSLQIHFSRQLVLLV
jgi:hypothetical protein